jgi:hypothetical protein
MDQIKSEELVRILVAMEGHPWAEFGRDGKPLTQNRLARLLKPYRITPGTIRIGPGPKDTAKGYKLAQFADVFERYLPAPSTTVTPSQHNNDRHFDDFQSVTPPGDVTDEGSRKPLGRKQCDVVTVDGGDVEEKEGRWTL